MSQELFLAYAFHSCEFLHAIKLVRGMDPSPAVAAIHLKSLCELNAHDSATEIGAHYIRLFPDDGALRYLHGIASYFAGRPENETETMFGEAVARGYQSAKIGLAFLETDSRHHSRSIRLLQDIQSVEPKVEYLRQISLADAYGAMGDLVRAEECLKKTDYWYVQQRPSLFRHLWRQYAWLKLHLATKDEQALRTALDGLLRVLDQCLTPRLYATVIDLHDKLVMAPLVVAKPGVTPLIGGIANRLVQVLGRKPMLLALYRFLERCGACGATKEDIIIKVWGENYNPLVHDSRFYKAIERLRHALGDHAGQDLAQIGRNYILKNKTHGEIWSPVI